MGHSHSHATGASAQKLPLAAALTLAFVACEAAAGWRAHSVALVSDAGHNFSSDALALGFSWFAIWIAKRPATARKTYGFHRMNILAALANAFSLVVVAAIIFYEAVGGLRHPEAAHGPLMIWVSLAAIALNLLISRWLHGGQHDLNVRSAYRHMLGDAASAAGVVIAGIVVEMTGWMLADPLVSLLIAALILWSSWGVLAEAINVLLEGAPEGLDMAAVVRAILDTPGVENAHDLHVWTITTGILACSCHVVVAEQTIREGQQVLRAVLGRLRHDFGIGHATVQIEVEGCEQDEMYCTMHEHGAHRH